MISVSLSITESHREEVIAELWEAGTTGITEETASLRAFFEDGIDVAEIQRRFAAYDPTVAVEENRDWVKESRAYWEPFAVGTRFFLVPEWREDEPPAGRIRLNTYPGLACGTGIHPATQLCLIAMETHLRAGDSALDVGTGTGILAQAAILLDARTVVACDIEPDAAAIAQANFHKTGAAVAVFAGSLRSLKTAAFDLAVANLNAATLTQMAEDLKRVAARLIVSGFREDEIERVKKALAVAVVDELTMDDWACLITAG